MVDKVEVLLFGEKTDRLNKALKLYSKIEIDLEQDINILKEWMKSQAYLPEIPSKYISLPS